MNRRGMALPLILMLCMAFLIMLTGLFFRTSSQKGIQPHVYEQTKALFLAKGINQLALYKIKALPADLYKSKLLMGTGNTELYEAYIKDFSRSEPLSPVKRILDAVPDKDNFSIEGGIASIGVQMKEFGFKKDLIFVFSFGKCNNQQQNFEALAEMDIKVDSF